MDLHRARNYQGTLRPWAPCVSATLGLPEPSQLECFPHFIPRCQRANPPHPSSLFSLLSLPISQRGSFRWKRYCLFRRCFLIFPTSSLFIYHLFSSTPDIFFCHSFPGFPFPPYLDCSLVRCLETQFNWSFSSRRRCRLNRVKMLWFYHLQEQSFFTVEHFKCNFLNVNILALSVSSTSQNNINKSIGLWIYIVQSSILNSK